MAIDYPTDSPSYLPRYIDLELDELKGASAIAIDGPKAVGKSETATRRANRTYFLDRDSERELLRADMDALLVAEDTLCIDEWQHLPQVWDAVRRNVDKQVTTRYLLTGSATPKQGVDTHSGAGRVISLRMRPLALSERADTSPTVKIAELFTGTATISGHTDYSLTDYAEALSATGLPGVCRQPARLRRQLIDAYVQRVIDRDVPEQGLLVRKPESLRAWWAAYAAASSTTTSYTKILNAASPGDAAKISKDSALGYRDILSKLWLLDPVPAWFPNPSPFKKLTAAPKHQIFDPGIAAALLGLTPNILTSGEPGSWELFGQLFESLVTLTVRAAGQASEAKVSHLRTQGGAQEIDLILERYDGRVVAFEVKLKPTPTDRDVRHLHWLGDHIGPRLADKVVVTTGTDAYRRPDGVAVVPLALLC